ncbi:MAG: flotillin-like FloA family protein [Clostridia bacterium]|nr:flotillin-like FloA family protein [Clostridia bacterium]
MEDEKRKNSEEIKELQMRTKTEEMKSAMLEAEAEVPKALSQAIKEGRFSVMDYYKLMNLQADTALRRSIITSDKKDNLFDGNDEGDLFE